VLARETYSLDPEDHKMQALLRTSIHAARGRHHPRRTVTNQRFHHSAWNA